MKDRLEELSLAARRGELPLSEERELEGLLDEAPDERIWHRAGLRFDEQDVAAAGDDELAGRLLERVLAEKPRALPRPRRTRPVMLLVAAAVTVASAAAAVVGFTQLRPASTPQSEAPPASAASAATSAPRAASPLAVEPAATSSALPEPAAPMVEPERAPLGPNEQLPATATELLSSAGQARRQGQAARAITLLESLQSRFPGSAEAQASDITLGMLRLERGAAGTALKDFDRYLARSPSGARAADALWGRSKALLALGRRKDAEISLQLLLSRFPQSPFTSAARAELNR